MPFWMSVIADGQRGDRAVDVGAGGVDGVQQRTGLAQRRLRCAHRVDQTHLLTGRARDQCACVGDVLIGEAKPLLGGLDVVGDRSQCGGGELVVQRGQRLLGRPDPAR